MAQRLPWSRVELDTLTRIAKQAGVSIERVEQALDEEAKRWLEANAAERRRRPGRRPQMLRDFWIILEVEWHRAQGTSLKEACINVAGPRKLSDRRVLNIYKPQADRESRALFRCHPEALVWFMERQLEKLRANGLEMEAEELRRRIEDLRSETCAGIYFGA